MGPSGFPYPENLDLANHLEDVVRRNGGVPATIAILDGVARVGIEGPELKRLLDAKRGPATRKLSSRDLSFICGLVRYYGHMMTETHT